MAAFSSSTLEQILTYLAKCRNENRDQFKKLEAQLSEFNERLAGIQEHLARSTSTSWADVYDYSCSSSSKVKGASENGRGKGENETCYYRRGNTFPNDERTNISGHCRTSTASVNEGEENTFVDVENTLDSPLMSHSDFKWPGSLMGDGGDNLTISRVYNPRESNVDGEEDDVQIVEEVAVPGKSSGIGKRVEFATRPSVLTKLTRQEALGGRKMLYGKIIPSDNNYNMQETESSTSSSLMDADVGDVNAIFDEPIIPVQTGPTTRQSTRRKQRTCTERANDGIQTQRKIMRIAKAPIKEDPEPLTSRNKFTFEDPPLVSPSSSAIKIKKERVAHAIVDGSKPANSAGPWLCICGHETDSKCGLLQHVKRKGTEEPKWQCPVETCDERFLYPFLVRKHVEKDHAEELYQQRGPDDDKLQGCDKCGKFFFHESDYRSHVDDLQCPRRRGERRNPEHHYNGVQNLGSPSLIITL